MTSAETERLRKLLNVPEINYSTALPGWVRASVKELIERGILPQGDGRATNGTVLESLRHATATFGAGWLDHSGRLEKDGREYLTSEPYVSRMVKWTPKSGPPDIMQFPPFGREGSGDQEDGQEAAIIGGF